jgi:hypothetical protein
VARWFLLFAAVASTSQMWAQDSNHPEPPKRDQTSSGNAAKQPAGLNTPGQISVPPVDAHVDTRKTEPGTAKAYYESQNDTQVADKEGPGSIAKRDLWAQESMARSAWWMVVLAIVQLVASGAGIYLLWHTLKSTRDAAKAATESADAARQAIFSERACMTIDRVQEEHTPTGFYLTPVWINSGRTPAIIKSILVRAATVSAEGPMPEPDPQVAAATEMVAVHGVPRKNLFEAGIFDWRESE